MPAYHSAFHSAKVDHVGNVALLPIKASTPSGNRGPVQTLPRSAKDPDVVDEALTYFKANVFFRTYEIRSGRGRGGGGREEKGFADPTNGYEALVLNEPCFVSVAINPYPM